ncbi:rhodanese-like domain-containing protein [Pararhodospirillum oryzae]|uniref:Rhodanese domain-containing protein n=1 Tax=Pararhodospirillum oryzae TaxID=478448 RepID=A0A512H959_9PROT|nr:rhodanese-like domain-containing protein [Pararhodospirillum oryzae]GEO81981.1 hypothetical protein ROR02_21120 [Pararhodospirillum oryzae]
MSGFSVRMIDASALKEWVAQDRVHIIDVREPDEYAAVHIPGARLVPLSAFDPTRIPTDPDRPVVLHCHTGARCGVAAHLLERAGYALPVHRLSGGLVAWAHAGGALSGR